MPPRQFGERPLPARGDGVDFAVAVELVAEEVREDDRRAASSRAPSPAASPRRSRGSPAARAAPGSAPASEASAASVAAMPRIRLEPLRLCSGASPASAAMRLSISDVVVLPLVPVMAIDAAAGLRCQPPHHARIDAQRHHTGDGRAAAAAQPPRRSAGGLPGHNGDARAGVHASRVHARCIVDSGTRSSIPTSRLPAGELVRAISNHARRGGTPTHRMRWTVCARCAVLLVFLFHVSRSVVIVTPVAYRAPIDDLHV